MTGPSIPNVMSMSALSAFLAIREYIKNHPIAPLGEIVDALQRSDADTAGIDFTTGVLFHLSLPEDLDVGSPDDALRRVLKAWINATTPWWVRLFPRGRERLVAALSPGEIQCFRAAKLLDDPPNEETTTWWDTLANERRAAENDARTEQGREAERLSLAFERDRLAGLGISLSPKWVAIENNAAGYDIHSYDPGGVEPVARLIEVKSSTQMPPRIVISRGEWYTALEFGSSYYFHVWSMTTGTLKILTSSDMEPHIPTDHGRGAWSEVAILVE